LVNKVLGKGIMEKKIVGKAVYMKQNNTEIKHFQNASAVRQIWNHRELSTYFRNRDCLKCINRGKTIRVIKKVVQKHTQTKPGIDKCKCVNAMHNNLAKDSFVVVVVLLFKWLYKTIRAHKKAK